MPLLERAVPTGAAGVGLDIIGKLELDVIQIRQSLLSPLHFSLIVEIFWLEIVARCQVFILFAFDARHFLLEHLQESRLLLILTLPVIEFFVVSFGFDRFILQIEVIAVRLALLLVSCQRSQRTPP